jgi:5-methylcytosine-specific restriction endonuclease McrA
MNVICYPLPANQRKCNEENCRWCGKEILDKRRSYCNSECRDKWINDIYMIEDFVRQRYLAIERDEQMCQMCKITQKEHKRSYRQDLHAHHIIPRHAGGSNYRDNLLTLCKVCHIELHKGMLVSTG